MPSTCLFSFLTANDVEPLYCFLPFIICAGESTHSANKPPAMTIVAPAWTALDISPKCFIPPSAITGNLIPDSHMFLTQVYIGT